MIGDVVGRPGRQTLQEVVPRLRRERDIDFIVANGENAAGGRGLTRATADEIFGSGVDVITSGNHIWNQKEIIPYLDTDLPVLRPLNYPPQVPGRGYLIKKGVLVVNLIGRVFLDNYDCPFRSSDDLLARLTGAPPVVIVDFHAEATSEKTALGWYLDGRVSAVLGTHTHVGTADGRILPQGTAYISDVGMVGPLDSIIGVQPQAVIKRFLTQMPASLPVAEGRVVFNSVLLDIEDGTGRARSIVRIDEEVYGA